MAGFLLRKTHVYTNGVIQALQSMQQPVITPKMGKITQLLAINNILDDKSQDYFYQIAKPNF
jgi:hypothetical protein